MTGDTARRILIVEDNELNLKLLKDLLDYRGYETVTSSFGGPAVELAREHRPDLILLDIQLPDIPGTEIAHRLKSDPQTRHIPIFAVTAFAMRGDRAKVLESGCDEYIAKPIQIADLFEHIARYLGEPEPMT